MARATMIGYEDFFAWCERQGLRGDRLIAAAFGMTPQTVRNWRGRLRAAKGSPPPWLGLACLGYEAARRQTGEVVPSFPRVSVEWFEDWRLGRGLGTLELTGEAFGLTRQAIHNWFKRESLPRWLPLACLGYEQRAAADVDVAA